MSRLPSKKAMEALVAAAKISAATRKNNNGSARAATPLRSASASRSRSYAAQLARAEEEFERMQQEPAGAAAAVASAKRVYRQVNSLEREIADLEQEIIDRRQAAEQYKENQASAREASVTKSASIPMKKHGVGFIKPSDKKAENDKVEAINKTYARMVREVGPVETRLRDARKKLEAAVAREAVSAAKLRALAALPEASPNLARRSSSTRRKPTTANNYAAHIANLRAKATAKKAKNNAAAAKKEQARVKKLASALAAMSEFDDETRRRFCEELEAGRIEPSRALEAAAANNA